MNRVVKQTVCLGAALTLVFGASCSGDRLPGADEPAGEVAGRQVPLQVAGASTGNGLGMETRADAGRTELTSGRIGLFLKADAANGYTAVANQPFSYGIPFWSSERQILLGDAEASLAAYYPYGEEKTTPLLLCSQCYSAEEDLHYVNFRADNTTSSVTLNLSRMYAGLTFEFSTTAGGDAYKGEGKVTAIGLEGEGIIPAATLDLFAQNASGTGIRTLVDPFTGLYGVKMTGFTTQFGAGVTGTAECLLIPGKLNGDIRFIATIDGADMTGTVTAEQLCGAGGNLTEGTMYLVRVTVKNGFVFVTGVDRQPWEEIAVGGDDYTWYPEEETI